MKKECTMLELLKMIKSTQDELDELYKKYIAPDSTGRAMTSLYNPSSRLTINGASMEIVAGEIHRIDRAISSAIAKLKALELVKESVNSSQTVTVDGNEYTVSQLLKLSSPKIKKYYLDYFNKLEQDYRDAQMAQESLAKSTMSEEKVSMYVNAKMNALHIMDDPDKATYGAFAKEYREANRMKILDPLNIRETIATRKKTFIEFYDHAQLALTIFNATTKLWIDFDEDTGRIEYDMGEIPSESEEDKEELHNA